MAVAFDAKPTGSSPVFDVSFTGATSVDLTTMTVGASANALVGGICFSAAVSSVVLHWDSAGTNQLMTQIGTATAGSGATLVNVYLFGLLAPTTGAKNLHATWTTSSDGYCSAISWTGVDQGAFATSFINFTSHADTNVTPVTVTVPTTVGNATVSWMANHGVDATGALNQTLWTEDSAGTLNQAAQYNLSAGTSTLHQVVLSGASSANISCGCDIVRVGGAPITAAAPFPLLGQIWM
jgi:hypothetical protein